MSIDPNGGNMDEVSIFKAFDPITIASRMQIMEFDHKNAGLL